MSLSKIVALIRFWHRVCQRHYPKHVIQSLVKKLLKIFLTGRHALQPVDLYSQKKISKPDIPW